MILSILPCTYLPFIYFTCFIRLLIFLLYLRVLDISLICKCFIIYMICKCFPSLRLQFLFPYIFIQTVEATNFDELQISNRVLWIVLLISNLRIVQLQDNQIVSHVFLTDILNFSMLCLGVLSSLSAFLYIMWCLDLSLFSCSIFLAINFFYFQRYLLKSLPIFLHTFWNLIIECMNA